ncbi:hypothetical protein [Aneurinibacillus terranovensis]|uniref:hypothetical protein n=1 Tax=Aneurinibacillus terranovensis TaxID=278991 RepID=UPI00040BCA83|nr:hypothetical protein [Aneurinibacillus terranovensis]
MTTEKELWGVIGSGKAGETVCRFLSANGCAVLYLDNAQKQLSSAKRKTNGEIIYISSLENIFGVDYLLYIGTYPFVRADDEVAVRELYDMIKKLQEHVKVRSSQQSQFPLLLLGRPFPLGTEQKITLFLVDRGINMSFVSFPVLISDNEVGGARVPQGVIIGCADCADKRVKRLRLGLRNFSLPIMIMPRREAELLAIICCYQMYEAHTVETLMEWCENNRCDGATILRGAGLISTMGQKAPSYEITPIRWVMNLIRSVLMDKNEGPFTIAVWKAGLHGERAKVKEIAGLIGTGSLHVYGTSLDANEDIPKQGHVSFMSYRDKWETLNRADALVILSPHPEFSSVLLKDWLTYKSRLTNPFIIDCCNFYEPDELRAIGYTYISLGRKMHLNTVTQV